MSFHVREHVVPSQHIGPCNSSRTGVEKTVSLAVKQYTPLNNTSPSSGDITIIGAHANGFGKELYEPMWEDLDLLLHQHGRKIRSIWIADIANQGASGLLNEDSKYDDVSWLDHPRDLLSMINHFRSEMIQPIIGMGHSMGGTQLIMLSIAHPTLFSSLVLLDPIIAPDEMIKVGLLLAKNSLHRRVEWPSREEAEKSMKKAFRTWDSRVLEKFNQYALFPPPIEGNGTSSQATRLTTGRFQELVGFVRPTFIYDGDIENENVTWVTEVFMAHKLIPYAPCNTLFICGEKSVSAGPEIRKDWLARSGTGVQGRIRRHERRVEEAVIPRRGHFVPLEAPRACAEAAARWIDEETKKWEAEEESGRRNWSMLSGKGRESRANAWMDSLKSKI